MKHALTCGLVAFLMATGFIVSVILSAPSRAARISEGLVLIGGAAALSAVLVSLAAQSLPRHWSPLLACIASGLAVGIAVGLCNTWLLAEDTTVTSALVAGQLLGFGVLGLAFGLLAYIIWRVAPNYVFKRTAG